MENYTNRGEYRTYQMLKKLGRKYKEDNFHIFGNLYIDSNDKFPNRQVDHLLICRNGIFMIETKYWSGTIYHNIRLGDLTKMVGGTDMRTEPIELVSRLLPNEIVNLNDDESFTMCIKSPTDIQAYIGFENPIRQVEQSGVALNKLMKENADISDISTYIHEFVFYNYYFEKADEGMVVDLNKRLDRPYSWDYNEWGEGFTKPQAFKDFYDELHNKLPESHKLDDQSIERLVRFIHEEIILD